MYARLTFIMATVSLVSLSACKHKALPFGKEKKTGSLSQSTSTKPLPVGKATAIDLTGLDKSFTERFAADPSVGVMAVPQAGPSNVAVDMSCLAGKLISLARRVHHFEGFFKDATFDEAAEDNVQVFQDDPTSFKVQFSRDNTVRLVQQISNVTDVSGTHPDSKVLSGATDPAHKTDYACTFSAPPAVKTRIEQGFYTMTGGTRVRATRYIVAYTGQVLCPRATKKDLLFLSDAKFIDVQVVSPDVAYIFRPCAPEGSTILRHTEIHNKAGDLISLQHNETDTFREGPRQ